MDEICIGFFIGFFIVVGMILSVVAVNYLLDRVKK
jgi:hypothetical protein